MPHRRMPPPKFQEPRPPKNFETSCFPPSPRQGLPESSTYLTRKEGATSATASKSARLEADADARERRTPLRDRDGPCSLAPLVLGEEGRPG